MRLNTIEASAYLGMSPSWLNKTRLNGTGPVYMKTGDAFNTKLATWTLGYTARVEQPFMTLRTITHGRGRHEHESPMRKRPFD